MKCGNCKQQHATAEEVRRCYHTEKFVYNDPKQVTVLRTAPPKYTIAGPTENQKAFLTQLLEQTGKTESDLSTSPDMMTFDEMSTTISSLIKERKELGKWNASPKQLASNIKGSLVPQGIYTVVFSEREGDYITLRFKDPTPGTKWEGIQLVSFLRGPNNDHDYQRCANWTGDGYRVWVDFKHTSRITEGIKHLARSSKDDQIHAGETYALKSNNCWRCNRTLTREESIIRGMGPICAGVVLGMAH